MANKLAIISNESIFQNNGIFFCDNIDFKSIPDGLSNEFDVSVISRKSKQKGFHQINLKKIKPASNIFTYLFNIFRTFENQKKK